MGIVLWCRVKTTDQDDIGKILRDLDAVGLSRDNLRVPKELLKFGRWGRPKMRCACVLVVDGGVRKGGVCVFVVDGAVR